MKKAVMVALVLLALGLTLVILIEEPAPDFTVVDVYGQPFKLSEHRGEVVILKFMFTTCPTCQEETNVLKIVRGSYSESDLVIVSLSVGRLDDESVLRAYKETNQADWVFAMDNENAADLYGVRSVPHIFVIDGSGRIASSYVGLLDVDGVSSRIDSAMSLIDPIITIILSVILIVAALGILLYLGYTKRDLIAGRFLGGADEN